MAPPFSKAWASVDSKLGLGAAVAGAAAAAEQRLLRLEDFFLQGSVGFGNIAPIESLQNIFPCSLLAPVSLGPG